MSAPAGNVLPDGTFELEFASIALHGYASDLSDDNQQRVAVHEYDRMPGSQTEWMGRGSWQCRVTLVFVGASAFLDAQAFLLRLDINPSGLLVHPVYGKRQATCSGTQGARLAADTPNTYTVPVTFIDNSADGQVVARAAQGVPAKAADVQAQAKALVASAGL